MNADRSVGDVAGLEQSADAEEFERLEAELAARARKRSPVKMFAILAVLGVALGAVLIKGLGSSSQFFLQADEAVARRATLGDRQFRLQGFVVGGSVVESAKSTDFDVNVNEAVVRVSYPGVPPELFAPDISVVVIGRFATGADPAALQVDGKPLFRGERILVKHDEVYIEKNGDRLDGAVDDPTL